MSCEHKAFIKANIRDAVWHYGGNLNKRGIIEWIDKRINALISYTQRVYSIEEIEDCICWWQRGGYCWSPPSPKQKSCETSPPMQKYTPPKLYVDNQGDTRMVDKPHTIVHYHVVPLDGDSPVKQTSSSSSSTKASNASHTSLSNSTRPRGSSSNRSSSSNNSTKASNASHTSLSNSTQPRGGSSNSSSNSSSSNNSSSSQSQSTSSRPTRKGGMFNPRAGVTKKVTLRKAYWKEKGIIANLLREKSQSTPKFTRNLIQTDSSQLVCSFMSSFGRGGVRPKIASIARKAIIVEDISFMDPPPQLKNNYLIQVEFAIDPKTSDTRWYTLRYWEEEGETYVFDDHVKHDTDIELTPFDAEKDTWHFPKCPIIEMGSEIEVLHEGQWRKVIVTQEGQTDEVFWDDNPNHIVLYELESSDEVFVLDTWLTQYRFVSMEQSDSDSEYEYTEPSPEDTYIHRIGEWVTYGPHDWEVTNIVNTGQDVIYEIKYQDQIQNLTAEDFDFQWQPNFNIGEQVVYDDKVVTITAIDYEHQTYTIESTVSESSPPLEQREEKLKKAKRELKKAKKELKKAKREMKNLKQELVEKKRDANYVFQTPEIAGALANIEQKAIVIEEQTKKVFKQNTKLEKLREKIKNVNEDQLSKLIEMNYEIGTTVVYNWEICHIHSIDNVVGSYVLQSETGEKYRDISDESLEEWCLFTEKDGSSTIWKKTGETKRDYQLENPLWQSGTNPNWKNAKIRLINKRSKNIKEQSEVDYLITESRASDEDDDDNGDIVVEFKAGDVVVVYPNYWGEIIQKNPAEMIDDETYTIEIISQDTTPWYLRGSKKKSGRKKKKANTNKNLEIGSRYDLSVSLFGYPATEMNTDDKPLQIDDTETHDGVEWVVTAINGSTVHWEIVQEDENYEMDDDEEDEEEEDTEKWEPELEAKDRVVILATMQSAIVEAIDYETEKIILNNGKSYKEDELTKLEEEEASSEEETEDEESNEESDLET